MYSGTQQSGNSIHLQHNSILFVGCEFGVKWVKETVCNSLNSARGHYTLN